MLLESGTPLAANPPESPDFSEQSACGALDASHAEKFYDCPHGGVISVHAAI